MIRPIRKGAFINIPRIEFARLGARVDQRKVALTSDRRSELVGVGSGATHLGRAQACPGGDVIPFIFHAGSFVADYAAGFFAGNGSEQHSDAETDADASQERRKTRAAVVRGQAGGNFFAHVPAFAGIGAFAEQVVHRCPHAGVGGQQT
jgi:hypothetical protein